jgi:hypothetical protein
MRALICDDDGQFRRVEAAIASIEAAAPCYRRSKLALLQALEVERASLLQYQKRMPSKASRALAQSRNRRLTWLNSFPGAPAMLGI